MINLRRQLMGLGFIAGSSIMAMGAAHALNGQTNINVDGGPLGQLEMSGGMAGYAYGISNNHASQTGYNSVGTRAAAVYLQLEKTSGVVQFFVKLGANNGAYTIGMGPNTVVGSMKARDTDALDTAYITLAPPGSPLSISVGYVGSNIGYESGTIWNDVSGMTSILNDVELDGNQYGGNITYAKGPINAFVQFGDMNNSHVFNYLEVGGTYNFTSADQLLVFAGTSLGRTGMYTRASGNYPGTPGTPAYGANSTELEGFYTFTVGNLTLAPEVQYIYDKVDHKAGIDKFVANAGAGVFGDYTFANTPYSLGGWVVWDKSIGSTGEGTGLTYFGSNDETISASIAPTWQYKYLYARLSGGFVYLLNNKSNGVAYGANVDDSSTKRANFAAIADTGFVF